MRVITRMRTSVRVFLTCMACVAITVNAQESRPQSVLFTNVMVWDGTSETLRDVDDEDAGTWIRSGGVAWRARRRVYDPRSAGSR